MQNEIKRVIHIKASPETVYSYLTEQDKAAQWFGVITEIDGRPGGIFKVGANNEVFALGEYVEVVPYEKVVFTWGGLDGLEPGESTVEITLEEKDNGTELVLRHYNIPNNTARNNFDHGWINYAFPLIKVVAEGGTTELRCFHVTTVPKQKK